MTPCDFAHYVRQVREKLQQLTEEPVEEKEINYGRQLKVRKGPDTVNLALYNGKKGLKQVWSGKVSPLQDQCRNALGEGDTASSGAISPALEPGGVTLLAGKPGFDGLWCGSDESGKGDYFGPLAVAAVCLDLAAARQYAAWGICDSKALTDGKIRLLAEKIRQTARAHTVLVLKPRFYNQRYAQLKARKQNLNHLLASGHIHALGRVIQQVPECRFALVDQFTRHNAIASTLETGFPGLKVYQQPKGEADMAVGGGALPAPGGVLGGLGPPSGPAGGPPPPGGGGGGRAARPPTRAGGGGEGAGEKYRSPFFLPR